MKRQGGRFWPMDTDLPPESIPLAELIGCPTRRYQPAWRIFPLPAEPRPPERTEALHPNGCWYDTETGNRIWKLDCGRPAPYGRDRGGMTAGAEGQPWAADWEAPDRDVPEWLRPGDSPFPDEAEGDQR